MQSKRFSFGTLFDDVFAAARSEHKAQADLERQSDVARIPRPDAAHLRNSSSTNGYRNVGTYMMPIGSSETLNKDKYDKSSPSDSTIDLGRRRSDADSVPYNVISAQHIEELTAGHPLPELEGPNWWREWRYLHLSYYMRAWGLIIAVNVAVIIYMAYYALKGSFTYGQAATATGANLLVSALMRHEHCVNMLYRIACALPHRTPIFIRRRAAKVYTYGSFHTGCGVSAFLWYIFYTVLVATQFEGTPGEEKAMAAMTTSTWILLAIMVCASHPKIRSKWHDQWELSHRFGGWLTIALVWAQTIVLVVGQARNGALSVGRTLVVTPTFWFLIVVALILIYPWLRLRRRKIRSERLSDRAARLYFDDKTLPTSVGFKLSRNPLLDNHGFATIPNANHAKGSSVIVSNAGNWTNALIKNPPTHIWTRGAPTTGVARIASLFRPVVFVATGSGIGPCLSYLQVHPQHPMRVIWSAPSPRLGYGDGIMNAVLKADRRAIIVDTKVTGRPDLPALTYAMVEAAGAEAVIIISNPVVTRNVVYEMEARGVPAFGAIFDS